MGALLCCSSSNRIRAYDDTMAMRAYDRLKKKNRNIISRQELIDIMRKMHFSTDLISLFLKTVNKNKDKEISREEFDDCFGYWQLITIYNQLLIQERTRLENVKRAILEKKLAKLDSAALRRQATQKLEVQLNGQLDNIKVTDKAFKKELKNRGLFKNNKLLKLFIKELDKNQDGFISMDEIHCAYQLAKDWKMFNEIDRDKNGTLDLQECIDYFHKKKYDIQKIKYAMKYADIDGDYTLDFQEFRNRFMKKLNERFLRNTVLLSTRIAAAMMLHHNMQKRSSLSSKSRSKSLSASLSKNKK